MVFGTTNDDEVSALANSFLTELAAPADEPRINTESVTAHLAQMHSSMAASRQRVDAAFARFSEGAQRSFRALSAAKKTAVIRKLVDNGITQNRIAALLGITQSAVSQHLKKRQSLVAQYTAISRIEAMRKAGVSMETLAEILTKEGVALDAKSLGTFFEVLDALHGKEVSHKL